MFLRFRRPVPASSLVEGTDAVVEGTVVSSRKLSIPDTGITCVYYDCILEKFTTGSRSRGRPMWLPYRTERKCVDFLIQGEGGIVLVKSPVESVNVSGASRVTGPAGKGKAGSARYIAYMVRPGDVVRVRGKVETLDRPVAGAQHVLKPRPRGGMEILLRRQVKPE